MGLLALAFVLGSFICAYIVFNVMKDVFRLPGVLNIPGAVIIFTAIMQFTGWAFGGIFDGYGHMSYPEVPWTNWVLLLFSAIVYYAMMLWAAPRLRKLMNE